VLYGLNALGALMLAIVGFWLAGLAEGAVHRLLMASKRMDVTVAGFLSSLVRYGMLAVVLVAMLQLVGIQATSLIAVLGAASLAIGLALQGTLSNMAAGVMMLLFRPFRVGDQIEVGGKNGYVKELNLFFTELATAENVQVLIPNAQVWGAALLNFSKYPTRRVEATVNVPHGEDVDHAVDEVQAFLNGNPHALNSPAPSVKPAAYSEEGIQLTVQVWAPLAETTALKYELSRFLSERRRDAGALQAAE
jgi:small conductance mechanosensitive channel